MSSLGEKHPDLCYSVNIDGTKNALDLARDHKCQLFVPSSIASFGGDKFRKVNTPNDEIQQPKTMYGATKVFNELLGDYYKNKFDVDFRCLRYPGVVSSEKFAFNGTACYTTGKSTQVV